MAVILSGIRPIRVALALSLLLFLIRPSALIAGPLNAHVTPSNWGTVTAAAYGVPEPNKDYSDAEIFTGPSKFGDNYFHGVLPNGKIVDPAGVSVQVGQNPLGIVLTPDGKYAVTTNDDDKEGGDPSLHDPGNTTGYSLTVIDTSTMKVTSTLTDSGSFFIGMVATGTGPYRLWASGGADNRIKVLSISATGQIGVDGSPIVIHPITPSDQGYVSNFKVSGSVKPAPSGFSKKGAHSAYPAGLALSPDEKYLYVACDGDNSLAVIDTATRTVVKQLAVGYFPYGVAVTPDGSRVYVTNWGVMPYRFLGAAYDASGILTSLKHVSPNDPGLDEEAPGLFYIPKGDPALRSSISVIGVPSGDVSNASVTTQIPEGAALDDLVHVGGTHPSAMVMVQGAAGDAYLYATKSNSDKLAVIDATTGTADADVDLSPIEIATADGHPVHGAYPNAIAVSPDRKTAYVAEAGLNMVAVLDLGNPAVPSLVGYYPTGWYPTGVAVSADGKALYVSSARGVGEDLNPAAKLTTTPPGTGVYSFTDDKFIFGTAQRIDLSSTRPDPLAVSRLDFGKQKTMDTSVVPAGGKPSKLIGHVFFIIHENKTFDSMLGNQTKHFGKYAGTQFVNGDGSVNQDAQYTDVALNAQTLADTFGAAVNYYSDAEESDAGHQFAASGTATDYTEKTIYVKSGRGLLVNKNFDAEDYPESGYIFNDAARNGVDFKDYGAMLRISGSDTGDSVDPQTDANAPVTTTINDPLSGKAGYPTGRNPLQSIGDVDSPTRGFGQSYFLDVPMLKVLGDKNASGEPRIDTNYPGYNFNISDQRRAREFIKDFDRMVVAGTLPHFIYIYQPCDHTGSPRATNVDAPTAPQQVSDGDVGLGMVVDHIMRSKAYYDPSTGQGSAIFITWDDPQSTLDHINESRTPLIVVGPYVKPGYLGKRHYSTASIVKTEELLLGLSPNNLGDLFATDLRDFFTTRYNEITADSLNLTRVAAYRPSPEGRRIWSLVRSLDTSAPDRDSRRLGALSRISMRADVLHREAAKADRLRSAGYRKEQAELYATACRIASAPSDPDDD